MATPDVNAGIFATEIPVSKVEDVPNPKFVLAPAAFDAPVPPWLTATGTLNPENFVNTISWVPTNPSVPLELNSEESPVITNPWPPLTVPPSTKTKSPNLTFIMLSAEPSAEAVKSLDLAGDAPTIYIPFWLAVLWSLTNTLSPSARVTPSNVSPLFNADAIVIFAVVAAWTGVKTCNPCATLST